MSERHIVKLARVEAAHISAAFVEERAGPRTPHPISEKRSEMGRAALFVSAASQLRLSA